MLRSFKHWRTTGFWCILLCLFNYHLITLSHYLGCSQVPDLSGKSVQGLSHQHDTLASTDSLPGLDHRRMLNKFHGHCSQSGDSQQRVDTAKTVEVKDSTHLPLAAPWPLCHSVSSMLRQLLSTQTHWGFSFSPSSSVSSLHLAPVLFTSKFPPNLLLFLFLPHSSHSDPCCTFLHLRCINHFHPFPSDKDNPAGCITQIVFLPPFHVPGN